MQHENPLFLKTSLVFGDETRNFTADLIIMEQFEQKWKSVEHLLQERFGKVPDMEGILFLIGINELGSIPRNRKFTKEQKQDLMHIAVCTLLSQAGYFELVDRDEDGWPHFIEVKQVTTAPDLHSQERLLKECVVRYFGQG